MSSPASIELRKQKAYYDLQAALDNLSTLKMLRDDSKFRQYIWEVASSTLMAFSKISKDERYLDVIEQNIRIIDTFYHATPQDWRQLAKRQHVILPQDGQSGLQSTIFNPPTRWDKYGVAIVIGLIVAIVGPTATFLIIRYFFHGP